MTKEMTEKKIVRSFLVLKALINSTTWFIASIYVMYMRNYGLTMGQISLVGISYFLVMMIVDVPTGAFSDTYGRKITSILGAFTLCTSFITYALANDIYFFVLAESIGAIGMTSINKSLESWMVDELKANKIEANRSRIFAKEQMLIPAVSLPATLIGGLIAKWDMVIPWMVSAGISLTIGILVLILVKETRLNRKSSFFEKTKELKTAICESVKLIRANRIVRFVMIMGFMQIGCLQAINMMWQPFYQTKGIDSSIGRSMICAGVTVMLFLGGFFAERFQAKIISNRKSLTLAQSIIGTGVMLAVIGYFLPFSLIGFMIHELGRGLYTPVKKAYLHKQLPSQQRATLSSFDSMMTNLGGILSLGIIGVASEYLDLGTIIFFSGLTLASYSFVILSLNNFGKRN